jgi:kynurenine formamidase
MKKGEDATKDNVIEWIIDNERNCLILRTEWTKQNSKKTREKKEEEKK